MSKNIEKAMMQLLPKQRMNKKGQTVGIGTVIAVAISLFIFVLIAIAIFAGSDSILSSNIFTSGSQSENDTTTMLANLTSATTDFAENFGTFFAILAVVIIMGFIGLLIFVVLRFRGAAGEGRGV